MSVEIQETAAESYLVRALREIDTLIAGREAIEAYRAELDVRRAAESLLDQQVEDLENANSAVQSAYENAAAREKELTAQLRDANNELDALRGPCGGAGEMLDLKGKLEQSDRAFVEADARRASVQELLSKSILRGAEEMQRADAAERLLASSQEKIRDALAECIKLGNLRANAESERDAAREDHERAEQDARDLRQRLDDLRVEHEKSDDALRSHRAELEKSLGNALRERDEALHATSVLRGTVKSTVDGLTGEIHKLTVEIGAKKDALRVANNKMDEAERDNLLAIKMARWFEDSAERASREYTHLPQEKRDAFKLVASSFNNYLERWEKCQWPKPSEGGVQ